MGVYKQKKSKNWWYKFSWNGEVIRESTKQTNKRIAEQMEAAHKTSLAKGEVGIREKKRAPTLAEFAEQKFLPFVRSTSASKPRTVVFYETTAKNLKACKPLADIRLDRITAESITEFVAKRRGDGVEVSTINRDLATLRRMFKLAQEWGQVSASLIRVRLLPGENRRERVLSSKEEDQYLEVAPQLLRDVAMVLLDCGLRPEECYTLRTNNARDRAIEIFKGKRQASRRRIPATTRVLAILDMRTTAAGPDGWLFPAPTKSGHIEVPSLKKQHRAELRSSKVPFFVLYDLRHTCLTRWAKIMDPFTLKKLAGHADLNTTMRYVHLNDDDVRAAMAKAETGHTFRHSEQNGHPVSGSTTARNQ